MIGAVERLLDRCTDALDAQGQPKPLEPVAVRQQVEAMAARGLRVLALARRVMAADHVHLEHDHVTGGLTFLGLQGMIDPPRAEAITAVKTAQEAGIGVKMITGDHLVTARAIAAQIGIRPPGGKGELQAAIEIWARVGKSCRCGHRLRRGTDERVCACGARTEGRSSARCNRRATLWR